MGAKLLYAFLGKDFTLAKDADAGDTEITLNLSNGLKDKLPLTYLLRRDEVLLTVTGTVTLAANDKTVTGVGTSFTTQLAADDIVTVTSNSVELVVESITSNTAFEAKVAPTAALTTGSPFTARRPDQRIEIVQSDSIDPDTKVATLKSGLADPWYINNKVRAVPLAGLNKLQLPPPPQGKSHYDFLYLAADTRIWKADGTSIGEANSTARLVAQFFAANKDLPAAEYPAAGEHDAVSAKYENEARDEVWAIDTGEFDPDGIADMTRIERGPGRQNTFTVRYNPADNALLIGKHEDGNRNPALILSFETLIVAGS